MSAPRSDSVFSSILDAYSIRIMLSLVASLGLLLALVRLPVQSSTQRVGWSTQSPGDRILLSEIDSERAPDESAPEGPEQAPPATKLQFPRPEEAARSTSPEAPAAGSSSGDTEDPATTPNEAHSVATLGTADRRPQIVGGAGSLYLHIDYPAEARKQGIEGQLILKFTVRRDGDVSDIAIAESLHPLCDSAAVEGLRSVDFVPAKHDGKAIPVRMELPVRFQLRAMSSSRGTPNPDR
ncbi:MAG: TonB family protein [Salinibacter sp.]